MNKKTGIYMEINDSIRLFNSVIVTSSDELADATQVNCYSTKVGYIVKPEACTLDVLQYFMDYHVDYNATFYKKWSDITDQSRLQLLIDQLIHYATSYATLYATLYANNPNVPVYIPNTGADLPEFSEYKVIDSISEREAFTRCANMLGSGIAMKEDTVRVLCDYLVDVYY